MEDWTLYAEDEDFNPLGASPGVSPVPKPRPLARSPLASPANPVGRSPSSTDSETFELLRAWRRAEAAALGVPAFHIFGDKILLAIAMARPQSSAEFLAVKGVGPAKLKSHGEAVLAVTMRRRGGPGAPAQSSGKLVPGILSQPMSQESLADRRARLVRESQAPPAPAARQQVPAPAVPLQLPGASAPADDEMSLSEAMANLRSMNKRQLSVWQRIGEEERSCFFHGAAGTGKSYVLRTCVALLKAKHGADKVAVTAPTGIAAVNVGGTTIHKFIGAGLCLGSVDNLVKKVVGSPKSCQRWKDTQVLVIDEVSMLTDDFLDKIDACGRAARGQPGVPFGGMQIVITGDFYQLPPVQKHKETGNPRYAFLSPAWPALAACTVELTEVVRQKEEAMVKVLNAIREGVVDDEAAAFMQSLQRPLPATDAGVLPTRLYSKNVNVDAENQQELLRLPGQMHSLNAVDTGAEAAMKALERCPAPAQLHTKVGAQVVLLRNMTDKLVNGSRGVVVGYADVSGAHAFKVHSDMAEAIPTAFRAGVPIVAFDNGQRVAIGPAAFSGFADGKYSNRLQVPLKLAWALTVHKSQGMTISRVEVSVEDAFDYGQVYVALSRAVSSAGLCVKGFDASKVKAHPLVVQFYAELRR